MAPPCWVAATARAWSTLLLVHEGEGCGIPLPLYPALVHSNTMAISLTLRVVFGPERPFSMGQLMKAAVQDRGTVFSLQPPHPLVRALSGPWIETVLYNFTGGSDGGYPFTGRSDLRSGRQHVRNHRSPGEVPAMAIVFKLTRSGSHWTKRSVLLGLHLW